MIVHYPLDKQTHTDTLKAKYATWNSSKCINMYFQSQYVQRALLVYGVFADTQWVWEQGKCWHCGAWERVGWSRARVDVICLADCKYSCRMKWHIAGVPVSGRNTNTQVGEERSSEAFAHWSENPLNRCPKWKQT